jgi:stage V sporulation protein AE
MFHVKHSYFFEKEHNMEILINCLKAFITGGFICLIGQILIDYTKLTPARILVSFVVSGVVLTALGIYEPVVKFSGAGATVPLIGFGYSLANGVKEAVNQYGLIGALSGGLTATAAGIAASVLFGYIMALLFKPGDKT